MSKNIDTTTSLLETLGLTREEGRIYLDIAKGRGETALTLSRVSGLKRTTVYRILDSLIQKGLIVNKIGERGGQFVLSPLESLDLLIAQKEAELKVVQQTVPKLQQELQTLAAAGSSRSQVLYYHGLDGLKQVTYNSLRARGELLTYELSTMNAFIDQQEAEELRSRFVANNIFIRTLTNATELTGWTDNTEMVLRHWDLRHLPAGDSPFQFEILIYNDVYCMYRYVGEEIFCVEIHSQELADQQRSLFNLLWGVAKPFKVLDTRGAAKLK